MNQSDQTFTSDRILEFLDLCQARVPDLDEGKKRYYFGYSKWDIENFSKREESGRRFSRSAQDVEEDARRRASTCLADHRLTKAKLAQMRAVCRRLESGDEREIPQDDENNVKLEASKELNDLWSQIVLRHQAA